MRNGEWGMGNGEWRRAVNRGIYIWRFLLSRQKIDSTQCSPHPCPNLRPRHALNLHRIGDGQTVRWPVPNENLDVGRPEVLVSAKHPGRRPSISPPEGEGRKERKGGGNKPIDDSNLDDGDPSLVRHGTRKHRAAALATEHFVLGLSRRRSGDSVGFGLGLQVVQGDLFCVEDRVGLLGSARALSAVQAVACCLYLGAYCFGASGGGRLRDGQLEGSAEARSGYFWHRVVS